ncbi:Fanconi anemia group J protein homolog isoform X2 [Maniola jurtina]|uniref:Fanconi anemia group J protein homolog isoform X2 n=1 Tax=Maniola jurtina TaxID=191418 RepID=UPI001E68E1C1|nr:Fanconi anemia group J protein homolog isoform X2 [Maniola jurtina]
MSSPIYISDDDDSFDYQSPPEKSTSTDAISITDDEDVDKPKPADMKDKRQALIKNLFPNTKTNGGSSSKWEVVELVAPVQKQPDFVKVIGGVSVHLPVNPYPCQIAVMFKVITAIEKKKNCLLESPTGTGKTLALLCSALGWQKKEHDRMRQQEASMSFAQHPELNQLDGALEYIASPQKSAIESPEAFFSKKIHGERSIYDSPQKQNVVNKRQEPHNDSFDSIPDEGLVKLQKKMRYNSDSSLSAACTTTACSCCSPELPSTPEKFIPVPEKETPTKISLPIIYYGARTHKQIQQVVKELGRTTYCGDARMSLLSARDHSCIREYDRSQWPSKNDMCSSCIKPLSSKEKQKIQTPQETNCKYYDNRKALNWKALPPAFDLKDLVTQGEIMTACPYYAAREMAKNADIVFCPYNYLIEPGIRKSMQIDLTDNIVIIDEGHNIEDICRDAATCNFTRDQVKNALKELNTVAQFRYANQAMMTHVEELQVALGNWDQWFGNQTPLINNQPVNGTEAAFSWQVENFVQTLNNHNIGQNQYSAFHENVEVFCRKFREDSRTLIGITQSTCSLLESLDTVLGFLFRNSGKHMDDFKPVLVRKLHSEVNDANAWRASQFNKQAEYGPLTLRLICMNPAVVFEGLHSARCIILASGTLTPQISMQSELSTEFPLKVSPKHIIPSDRVWIGSLSSCPDGTPLECTSQGTKQTVVQDALGEAVYEVCRVTPHGVLCFFPSYQRMNGLVRRWRQTGLWRRLKELKNIFMESSDAKDHDNNMEEYYDCVGSDMGALLFAVYRGKVAEGMDFKDRQARAVITIGVPYPNKYDIAVSEKMKYNDKYLKEKNLLSGTDWYLVQAYRALNQAVGRCVRHSGDWGAVLLLDARFREHYFTQHLSAWVKEYLGCNHHTFNSLVNGTNSLKSFMEEMTRRENK